MRTDAFWSRVERRGDDECWNWQGARNERGYGRWRGERAHRLTYALANGIIPAGLIIRHKCDNPRCVNPGHLEPGTHKENTADCLERGRFPIGATHGNTKLRYYGAYATSGLIRGRRGGFGPAKPGKNIGAMRLICSPLVPTFPVHRFGPDSVHAREALR